MPRLSAHRDKFFLNGAAKYEQDKVQRWYNWYGRNIIKKYRSGMCFDVNRIYLALNFIR